jgi:chaperonin GroEL (HSP60 family)
MTLYVFSPKFARKIKGLSLLERNMSQFLTLHRTVLGAGCSESLMAMAVEEYSKKSSGKKSLAIEGFANALRQIPQIIANNAGMHKFSPFD